MWSPQRNGSSGGRWGYESLVISMGKLIGLDLEAMFPSGQMFVSSRSIWHPHSKGSFGVLISTPWILVV